MFLFLNSPSKNDFSITCLLVELATLKAVCVQTGKQDAVQELLVCDCVCKCEMPAFWRSL